MPAFELHSFDQEAQGNRCVISRRRVERAPTSDRKFRLYISIKNAVFFVNRQLRPSTGCDGAVWRTVLLTSLFQQFNSVYS